MRNRQTLVAVRWYLSPFDFFDHYTEKSAIFCFMFLFFLCVLLQWQRPTLNLPVYPHRLLIPDRA